MTAANHPFIESLKHASGALLDAYVVVDAERRITEFNRLFFALFPRSVARALKRHTLDDVLTLQLEGNSIDLLTRCLNDKASLRYDEVTGIIKDGETLSLIVSAAPISDEADNLVGAFLCLRNVTDEAQVQSKYKTMLEQEARERQLLEQRVQDAEAQLVTIKDQLNSVEDELRDHKKGLLL